MKYKWLIVISITLMFLTLASASASDLDQSAIHNTCLYDCVDADDLDTDSYLHESLDINENVPELPSDNSCNDDDDGTYDADSSADDEDIPVSDDSDSSEDIDDEAADDDDDGTYDADDLSDDVNDDSINSDDNPADSDITDGDSIIRNMTKDIPKNYNDKPISNIRETSNTFSDLQDLVNITPWGFTLVLNRDFKAVEDKHVTISKQMTIDGNGHTIDCAGLCRAFYVARVQAEFWNLNIINGYVGGSNPFPIYLGGAIYDDKGSITIDNCNFTNNYAEDGAGAIYDDGDMFTTIRNCIFRSNTAEDGPAGALQADKLWVYNSKFIGNSACDDGGAIWAFYGDFFDCTFIGNSAGGSGGAIHTNMRADDYRSIFQDNSAGDDGGAIYSMGNVNISGSTFSGSTAGDYGGAIYSEKGVNINQEPGYSQSSFINNKALDDKGGAIYSEIFLYAYNALFTGNSAYVDGGAIWSKAVEIDKCSFSLNRAAGASSKCYGGAVRASSLKLVDSIFHNNFAENHGGAIFTDTFDGEVKNCTFNGNQANEDGGAVYINNKNDVKFYLCKFIGNQAKEDGGAVYLDSDASHISLINNIISGNAATEGQVVYNKGHYDSIYNNWWGPVNPSSDNNMLVEWRFWTPNVNHVDVDPLRMVLELDYAPAYVGDIDRATAYFVKSDGSRFDGLLPIDDLLTISSNGLKTIYSGHTANSVFVDFLAENTGIYNIISEYYGVKCIELLVVFDSKELSGSNIFGIFNDNIHAKSTIAKDILPNIVSCKKIFASSNGKLNIHSNAFKLNGDSISKQFGKHSAFNPFMKSLNHQQSCGDFNIVSRLFVLLSQFGL